MKKQLIFLAMLVFVINTLTAQDLRNYIQFDAGWLPFVGGYALRVEYGQSRGAWDIGLSLGVTNELPMHHSESFGITIRNLRDNRTQHSVSSPFIEVKSSASSWIMSNSLMLNVRLDLIRLFFGESNHSVKIGAAGGVVHYQRTYRLNRPEAEEEGSARYHLGVETFFKDGWLISLKYEYALNEKISLGLFAGALFNPCRDVLGLSLRRRF